MLSYSDQNLFRAVSDRDFAFFAFFAFSVEKNGHRIDFKTLFRLEECYTMHMTNESIFFVPDEKYFPIAMQILQNAQDEILISNFKMQSPAGRKKQKLCALYNALEKKAGQGVTIKILLHGLYGKNTIAQANIATARVLQKKSIEIRTFPIWRTIHAKIIIADGKKMLIGSHNWTQRSLVSNFELSLQIENSAVITTAKNFFLSTWKDAIPFTR